MTPQDQAGTPGHTWNQVCDSVVVMDQQHAKAGKHFGYAGRDVAVVEDLMKGWLSWTPDVQHS